MDVTVLIPRGLLGSLLLFFFGTSRRRRTFFLSNFAFSVYRPSDRILLNVHTYFYEDPESVFHTHFMNTYLPILLYLSGIRGKER